MIKENIWIKWTGGERPVEPEVIVEIELVADSARTCIAQTPAGLVYWGEDCTSVIVGYRVL